MLTRGFKENTRVRRKNRAALRRSHYNAILTFAFCGAFV
jgi:hypothetical protein